MTTLTATPTPFASTRLRGRHRFLRRLLRRRPPGRVSVVPIPTAPDGPPLLSSFTDPGSHFVPPLPTSTPRPRPHHGRDFFCAYARPVRHLRYRCAGDFTRSGGDDAGSITCQSVLGLSGRAVGAAVRRRQAGQARRRRGAVPRRRSGRRLLSRRAGPAQGQHDRGVRRRADPGDRRAGRHRRRTFDHRRPAALGLGRGRPRFRIDLRQPRRVPGLRRRSIRRCTGIW